MTLIATDNGDGLGPAGVLSGTYTFQVTVQSPTQVPTLGYLGDQVAIAGQPFTLESAGRRGGPGHDQLGDGSGTWTGRRRCRRCRGRGLEFTGWRVHRDDGDRRRRERADSDRRST